MIRGKAFEFSAMVMLQNILDQSVWKVDKPLMNAQTGLHDIDVRITHIPTGKVISGECKMSKKGAFRKFADGHSEIRVKCMRSRTLGPSKVKELAPKLGVSEEILSIHNDQYLPGDFDVVITTLGNAFYKTDNKGLFVWAPTKQQEEFLYTLGAKQGDDLRAFAFNQMYIAHAKDITIGKLSGVSCTRKKCKNKAGCGFIPNYPIIFFDKNGRVNNNWHSINNAEKVLSEFI
jgi:hypothetical protein